MNKTTHQVWYKPLLRTLQHVAQTISDYSHVSLWSLSIKQFNKQCKNNQNEERDNTVTENLFLKPEVSTKEN